MLFIGKPIGRSKMISNSEAWLRLVTHTTFQELLLTPFTVHEIVGFEILSSEKHFCHEKIFEILFRAEA